MAVFPWKFTQLGGSRKTFTLSGWNAPFGRPRREPMAEDGVELREKTVYYPGNDQPTTFVFGTKLDDLVLHGRWTDQQNGPGGARRLVEMSKEWLRDQQLVRVDWGPQMSVNGLLKKFVPGRESAHEYTWMMRFRVLSDNQAGAQRRSREFLAPADITRQVKLALLLTDIDEISSIPNISGTFLDLIDDAVTALTTATGYLDTIAQQMSDFSQATFGELARMRGAIAQVGTAISTMMLTWDAAKNQTAMLRDSGDGQIGFSLYATQLSVDAYVALALLADADKQAELAQRGNVQTTYVVKSGDTWESISTYIFGDASKADVLRQANNVRYGQPPTPGAKIHVAMDVAA